MNNTGSSDAPTREEQTPLARLVRGKLAELHMRQIEFCRMTGFDQGLLSRIQNSMVNTLSLESALKLAIGLRVTPRVLLELLGRPDLNDLVLRAYGDTLTARESPGESGPSNDLAEVKRLAELAQSLGKDLTPIRKALYLLVDDWCSSAKETARSALPAADLASPRV